jgi:predicted GH43/DUF377 family glycosyl hydrolase
MASFPALFLLTFLLAIPTTALSSQKMDLESFKNINKGIVTSTFRIDLPRFPQAHNPSICEGLGGYILTFRYKPNPKADWISYVGIVRLDAAFQVISEPQLLDLRWDNKNTPSQTEDARIFSYQNDFYILYNDNPDKTRTSYSDRRDMYLAKLLFSEDYFTALTPLKLEHKSNYKYKAACWEKNWSPFICDGTLHLSYSVDPHEVIIPNLVSGKGKNSALTSFEHPWNWGILRGGTPAQLIDGEYLAFFHSSLEAITLASNHRLMWHYFMGAYTFSPATPFKITKISPVPIYYKNFYENSNHYKRVIFPGGFVVVGENLYLAFGKDDCEIWIAEINKERLLSSLRSIE